MKRTLAVLALALSSCSSLDVAPIVAFRDAVRSEHLAYVLADPKLTPEQVERRKRTWDALDVWIREVSK